MLLRLVNIINSFKLTKKNIDKTTKDIKVKKNDFDRKWNTWGVKKSNTKKIP